MPAPDYPAAWPNCECGCGKPAPAIQRTNRKKGLIAGEPRRFLPGHHRRSHPTAPERFWAKVDRGADDACWPFTAGKKSTGYGEFWVDGQDVAAHRFAYEDKVGPIPDGLHLDHLCRNRACVNPAHLEPVTHRENVIRGEGPSAVNARKTHCANGHELTQANTYTPPGTRHRLCRQCRRTAATLTPEEEK